MNQATVQFHFHQTSVARAVEEEEAKEEEAREEAELEDDLALREGELSLKVSSSSSSFCVLCTLVAGSLWVS